MPDELTRWEVEQIKREIASPEGEKENKNNIPFLIRTRDCVAKVLVVGGAATVAITIPTVMVLATLNKQPEFAAMLAKTGGFAGILALGGFGLGKIGKKQEKFNREESDDELQDC